MASLNKVMLIGNLGVDPELKYTPGGQAVATFRIATSRQWKDKDGNSQEDTQWHNIKVWGRSAEVAQQYLKKGRQIYVEGRIETRQYDDKDGNRKYFTEIVSERFLMLGSKRDDTGGGEVDYDAAADSASRPASRGYSSPAPKPPAGEDDDLPF
ncbi:MAG: single-stranded DNA-binding protein [Candidatus Zixiibacteriota bacterium]